MNPLPIAPPEIKRFFHAWLETFAGYVREVDYAAAKPLFHPDVLAFGTHNDVIPGLDKWVLSQWDHVWPKTTDFRFIPEQTSVLASSDGTMAIVIAPWTSLGYFEDGRAFPRPGRATLVFSKDGDRWLCTHSHMSLNRGVPQSSHANRPVKAWEDNEPCPESVVIPGREATSEPGIHGEGGANLLRMNQEKLRPGHGS